MDESRRKFMNRFAISAVSAKMLLGDSALADQSLNSPSLLDWRDEENKRPEANKKSAEILILGAGISGLVAAYELTKAGYNCKILEARERPGGRNETIRSGDVINEIDRKSICQFSDHKSLYFNTGPGRISQFHTRLLGYCRELGVEMETFVNENYNASCQLNKGYAGKPVKLRELHASQRGMIASMLAQGIDQGLLSHYLESENIPKMLEMLRDFGDLSEDYSYSGSTRAGYLPDTGVFSPQKAVDSIDFTEFMDSENPYSLYALMTGQHTYHQPAMLQPVGGMDKIPYAFARQLKKKIKYGAIVNKIKRSSRGATIDYTHNGKEKSISANQVIVTIPLTVLKDIDHDFSDPLSQAIDGAFYSAAGKIAFESERFWERDHSIYGGISYMESANSAIWYPSGSYNSKKGILGCGYLPMGLDFAAMDNHKRIESALSQVEHTHPEIRRYASRAASRSWYNTPFSKGGWSALPPSEAFSHPDGPYVFAGDHTTYMAGWQEGAVLSAHRAIEVVTKAIHSHHENMSDKAVNA